VFQEKNEGREQFLFWFFFFKCEEAEGVSPGEADTSADLGGSSKYSSETLED
jgi:hypothetical protein